MVDLGLATLSDRLVLAAILLYVLGLLAFAADFSFRPARASVMSGASVVSGASSEQASPLTPGSSDTRVGRVALALTVLGWAAHLGAIVTRGLSVERWPWGNMYEFVLAICFAAVTAYLVLLIRQPVRYLGVFVLIPVALGLGFAVRRLYTEAAPVEPILDSYWIAIHVVAAVVASGFFILAAVVAVLHLVQFSRNSSQLPAGETLERLAHRAIVFAFPIWTFAVIAGALWADKAWGRYWGWDPKETWAFITWIGYAAYLHAALTMGWRGRRAMVISLIACACLLFNLVGVNMFISGLHSYADVG